MALPSSLPPSLDDRHTSRLRGANQLAPTAEQPATEPPAPLSDRAKEKLRVATKKGLRRAFEVAGGKGLVELMTRLQGQLRTQQRQIDLMRAQLVDTELQRADMLNARQDVEGTRINLELLKGELRHLQQTLDELGMAFAPGTGLHGAGARFAEQREAINSLERQLRNLSISRPASNAATNTSASTSDSAPAAAAPTSTLFNYVGFERRFRGDPVEINATLQTRYQDLLAQHQPVVDIGCGRGELLETLAGDGLEVIGVEPDPGMVAEARARGITVHQALAGDYLRGVTDHSLGSIINTHVAEHLPLDALIEMLELSVKKLRPGGVFIAETPNPASLIVLGNSYILDPTHVLPLHPSLFAFLCESAGFRDVRLAFYSPATGYHLASVEAHEASPEWAKANVAQINTALGQLNDVLFGPQEYAVIATTPS